MGAKMAPTSHQRRQISVKALVHPKTIDKCYAGKPVRESCALRIVAAAKELGLEPPKPRIA